VRGLNDCRLYGFVDLNYVAAADAERVTKSMIDGGVDLIQLRAKKSTIPEIVDLAGKLHAITSPTGVPLIVNDYAEVAAQIEIEGVHVGQDDDSIAHARKKAARKVVVGKSTHSLEQATAAQREGADYVGFGPIFATPTKPDYQPIGQTGIKRVHNEVTVPIFCIGGIKIDNLGEVLAAGAKRVAIVSGLLKAPDIAKYARACKAMLQPES
jgi:thiamine-phosphate pyrophosphorylase